MPVCRLEEKNDVVVRAWVMGVAHRMTANRPLTIARFALFVVVYAACMTTFIVFRIRANAPHVHNWYFASHTEDIATGFAVVVVLMSIAIAAYQVHFWRHTWISHQWFLIYDRGRRMEDEGGMPYTLHSLQCAEERMLKGRAPDARDMAIADKEHQRRFLK